jgi:DNA polymerase III sliding clamp (beta) subunit (PCNA family)
VSCGDEQDGECCLPGDKLLSFISGAAGDIALTDERVSSGRSYATLRPLNARDFPVIDHHATGQFAVSSHALQRGLRFVLPHMAEGKETRAYLIGALLWCHDDMVELAGTDGHSGAVVTVGKTDTERRVILPAATVELLAASAAENASDETMVSVAPATARFALPDGREITSKLIDATYPNLHQLIPAPQPEPTTIDVDWLAKAVAQAEAITGGSRIMLDCHGAAMKLTAGNAANGEYVAETEIAPGADWHAWFAAKPLKATLASLGDLGQAEWHPPSKQHQPHRIGPVGNATDCIVLMPLAIST